MARRPWEPLKIVDHQKNQNDSKDLIQVPIRELHKLSSFSIRMVS